MIPLVDLLMRKYVEDGIEELRNNPEKIERYFSMASDKTMKSMRDLITGYKIEILSGFPRKETQLPCVIISLQGEEETNYGIGDGIDELYEEYEESENYLQWDKEENHYLQETIQMHAQVRVEIWSDNAVITSFLFAIVKYCLLSHKRDMIDMGIILPRLGGGDLEPVPDYFPQFVYRRAVTVNFDYELSYHVSNKIIGEEDDHMAIGTTIDDITIEPKGVMYDGKKE